MLRKTGRPFCVTAPYGVGVAAASWAKVKPGLKRHIDARTTALAQRGAGIWQMQNIGVRRHISGHQKIPVFILGNIIPIKFIINPVILLPGTIRLKIPGRAAAGDIIFEMICHWNRHITRIAFSREIWYNFVQNILFMVERKTKFLKMIKLS